MSERHHSRRGLLALGGAALAGGAAAGTLTGCRQESHAADAPADRVPFYGTHQAGIATPAQDRLAFATYDITATGGVKEKRAALRALLRTWTAAAAAMTQGRTVPGDNANLSAPPADTGEAYGLSPANLTITFGLGPSLFDDRFGLADRRPAALADLPHLPPADLDPDRSGGDLAIQACADDPLVAFHAIRNLARIGRDTVVMRWSQLGFGKAASNGADQQTPRNLMGFKDGTRNIHGDDTDLMNEHVWVGKETDQAWMRGGSYLVARRIQMRIEGWDRDYLADQQNVFGRHKYSGAPLTGSKEFDTPDFKAKGADGRPVIPANAHMRLAAHENNGGIRILRRGYSFTDGIVPSSGELDAGLFFIAFQKDPREQFVALQRKLGMNDALNEYIQHVGSGLFACPPGVSAPGRTWAEELLA
ncbi:iron uptake transporter deferrochelatase/peroxidase subunit [Streptomyces incarnatus]|uniref:iron uptake transporter deferrochelatase/peroxidase subunit n=1 Tax=Streptomyces sp. HF10 TaxID=2692233 RepID=UPI00119F6CF6|nr:MULTISPECIES: iron uptake transporter deferrochelatase/peroxidase subunit [Streptomyces]QHC29453.1 deferrochelatase/peroxidase EfeB [Streptomyces sp. HF10]